MSSIHFVFIITTEKAAYRLALCHLYTALIYSALSNSNISML